MKGAMKVYNLGQLLMILGSAMYVVELFTIESKAMTMAITAVYLVSLVLMAIGWLGTKEERKAEKERQKREEAARKAAKRAA